VIKSRRKSGKLFSAVLTNVIIAFVNFNPILSHVIEVNFGFYVFLILGVFRWHLTLKIVKEPPNLINCFFHTDSEGADLLLLP